MSAAASSMNVRKDDIFLKKEKFKYKKDLSRLVCVVEQKRWNKFCNSLCGNFGRGVENMEDFFTRETFCTVIYIFHISFSHFGY